MANRIEEVLNGALDGIKNMVNADTIIGTPMEVAGGVTLIPISKVSFGFASGGSSFGKTPNKDNFGGGAGGGVKITPIAFIVSSKDGVNILSVSESPDAYDKIINLVPGAVDKIVGLLHKDKEQTEADAE